MKKFLFTIIAAGSFFSLISCGSKPAPENKEKPQAPVENVVGSDDTDGAKALAAIEDARRIAIEAGANEKAPLLLKKIDDLYQSLKKTDANNIKAQEKNLIQKYQSLTNYIKAKDAKDVVDEYGFASLAQSSYDDGVANLKIVENAYSSGEDITKLVEDAANKAYSDFNTVLVTGFKKLAKEERDRAFQAKRDADSVKAGVSRKDSYKEAAEAFKTGDSLYSMQSPEKAYYKYKAAKEEFTALYQEVNQKRAAAQAAIDEAKRKVEESALYAVNADAQAPLTGDVEGIEDEGAVLLEEDKYEAPEESEIAVSDSIDDIEDSDDSTNKAVQEAE